MAAPPSYEMTSLSALPEEPNQGPTRLSTSHDSVPHESLSSYKETPGRQQELVTARPVRPMYEPSQQIWHTGQSTTVIVNPPVVRPGPAERITSPEPCPTLCFNCGEAVVTYLYYEAGTCTYMACVALLCLGCDVGCCLIPFCVDYFKDRVHKCPKCHVILGKYKRI